MVRITDPNLGTHINFKIEYSLHLDTSIKIFLFIQDFMQKKNNGDP